MSRFAPAHRGYFVYRMSRIAWFLLVVGLLGLTATSFSSLVPVTTGPFDCGSAIVRDGVLPDLVSGKPSRDITQRDIDATRVAFDDYYASCDPAIRDRRRLAIALGGSSVALIALAALDPFDSSRRSRRPSHAH